MKYILCERRRAVIMGIEVVGHRVKEDKIILNEKEVMSLPMNGDLEDRCFMLSGTIMSEEETTKLINKDNYQWHK